MIERKWYNKILGFRSKTKWKMATAGAVYAFLFVAVIGGLAGDDEEPIAADEVEAEESEEDLVAAEQEAKEQEVAEAGAEREAEEEALAEEQAFIDNYTEEIQINYEYVDGVIALIGMTLYDSDFEDPDWIQDLQFDLEMLP